MKLSRIALVLPAVLLLPACGSSDSSPAGGGGASADASVDSTNGNDAVAPDATEQDSGIDATNDTASPDSEVPDATANDAGDGAAAEAGPDRPCTLGGTECNAGEKCSPEGTNQALVCRPAGDKQQGEACGTASVDDCAAGLACVAYSSTLSTCEPLCNTNVACADTAHQACFPWFGTNGEVAGVCLGDNCTPPSTGCSNGQRCTVYSSGNNTVTACAPAGTVPVGGDCSVDECVAGAMCVQTSSQQLCRAFCDGGADCTAVDLHCAWQWSTLPTIGLCAAGCDPVRQTGCGNGESCYFSDPDVGSTLCWATGTLAAGADCGSSGSMCQAGYDCVLQPGSSPYQYYCRAYCDADHPCATGTCTTTDATKALKFCMP